MTDNNFCTNSINYILFLSTFFDPPPTVSKIVFEVISVMISQISRQFVAISLIYSENVPVFWKWSTLTIHLTHIWFTHIVNIFNWFSSLTNTYALGLMHAAQLLPQRRLRISYALILMNKLEEHYETFPRLHLQWTV